MGVINDLYYTTNLETRVCRAKIMEALSVGALDVLKC
jgi:hypothetical protein